MSKYYCYRCGSPILGIDFRVVPPSLETLVCARHHLQDQLELYFHKHEQELAEWIADPKRIGKQFVMPASPDLQIIITLKGVYSGKINRPD